MFYSFFYHLCIWNILIKIFNSIRRRCFHSKDILQTLSYRSRYFCNTFKTFDFSTSYTTILHACTTKSIVSQRRTGNNVIGIFLLDLLCQNLEINIKNVIILIFDVLIDNIFVQSGGLVFLQTMGIPLICFYLPMKLIFNGFSRIKMNL